MKTQTFNIIGMNTGRKRGTIKAINMQEAENRCIEKGLDMWDIYMLVSIDDKQNEIHSPRFNPNYMEELY